jgi:hypothetical protein
MRKITKLAGTVGVKLRDRSRSVKWRVLEIARAARGKSPPSRDKLKAAYSSLLQATGRVAWDKLKPEYSLNTTIPANSFIPIGVGIIGPDVDSFLAKRVSSSCGDTLPMPISLIRVPHTKWIFAC